VRAAQTTPVGFSTGLGLFVLGWAIQFVGLLFLAAEVAFALGWRLEMTAAVEQRLQRDSTAATPGLRSFSGSARP
jgi:uncharacterized membrane protein YGL010W